MIDHDSSERRMGQDRRARPTSPFTLVSMRGRRKEIRRTEDLDNHKYVDRYDRSCVLLVVLTLLLSVADAFLTLMLLTMGGTEINPVMAFFLDLGPLSFFWVKYALTACGIVWLIIHKNFELMGKVVRVKSIMKTIPTCYSFLIGYELLLVF